jgi:ParB-like nuclease domain
MPTPGLSLVGFLDQAEAINHLLSACVPQGSARAALIAEWNTAKRRLGAPIPNAGHPDIKSLPAAQQAHAEQVLTHPIFQDPHWQSTSIQIVEIDPILAYQMTIDSNRLNHYAARLSSPSSPDELMQCCLPLVHQSEDFTITAGPTSMVLRARSLNVRAFRGFWRNNQMGIDFGVRIPFIQVVRHGGRCYLANGCHRAVAVRRAGATHMPCVVRDVPDQTAVGMYPPDFFSMARLTQPDPPTVGHYVHGRAYSVALRLHSRIVHISWGEHTVPEE